MQIGTKELKNRLSHYLRAVREGEVVHVTDRGRVVAELRAARRAAQHEGAVLAALAAAGIVTPGASRVTDFTPVRTRGRVRASRIVMQDRR